MAKRDIKDKEVNIFNFSFLDILACTVGALIFILVMVVMVNAYSASHSELRQRIQELENRFAASESQAAELAKRKSRTLSELKQAENALILGKEHLNLIQEMEQKKKEVERLRQQIEHLREKTIQIWAPREYSTKKVPIPSLVFKDQCVAPLDQPFFRTKTFPNGERGAVQEQKGEPLNIVFLPRSAFSSTIRMYNPKQNFVPLVVYPSGFRAFRTVRDYLLENDWDYSLNLLSEDEPIIFGSGKATILR